MLTDGKLSVFENFRMDYSLPKFHDDEMKKMIDTASGLINIYSSRSETSNRFINLETESEDNWQIQMSGSALTLAAKPSVWAKLAFWKRPRKVPEPPVTMSIPEFFANIKNSASELVIVKERAAGYERALHNAKKMGQSALLEQLQAGLNAYRMETQLLAMGLSRYVEEEPVIRFYKQCKRGLRLDWVKNFGRQIPESVIATKTRADELGIFDNYVVLHYDPEAKAYVETEKEKEARKDPILFGIMKGRRLLYFVGDWVDEFCDLTLDQFADVMGREAVQNIALPSPYREPAP